MEGTGDPTVLLLDYPTMIHYPNRIIVVVDLGN